MPKKFPSDILFPDNFACFPGEMKYNPNTTPGCDIRGMVHKRFVMGDNR